MLSLIFIWSARLNTITKKGEMIMLFAHDGNVELALKNSIENSIKEREGNICET